MLILGSQLLGSSVMGLQTGTQLAKIKGPVIDPRTLTVTAYELEGPLLDENPSFLVTTDIREIGEIGIIIDSSDELVGLEDVVKLKKVYNLHFPLVGLQVVDTSKRHLGKVADYTIEMGSFVIQQLEVKRPILKSISDSELLIHRSQITEINDTTITVKSGTVNSEPIRSAVKAYVNPFRQPGKAQPEAAEIQQD